MISEYPIGLYLTVILYIKGKVNSSALKRYKLKEFLAGDRVVRWYWVNFQCRGILPIWIIVGHGPTALATGAGRGYLDIFTLVYHFSSLSPSLEDGLI